MTDALPGEVLAGLLAATALRRVVTPAEVADAVFATAAATAVTGQTLVVDGGRVLH
jgi:3-oxoacyl-[acyl-carrier protein] reductase